MLTIIKIIFGPALAFSALIWSISALALTDVSASLLIATDKGLVVGSDQNGHLSFKGIPFAEPPVGPMRWMPPVPAAPWHTPLEATKFRDVCATNLSLGGFAVTGESEDCLYLNVYAPSRSIKTSGKLPVMVWIHGGGLGTGSGNDYDVTRLLDKGVIVVTINYRLGVFGYFSHPAINSEGHPAINYGTMDQQAALKWVNKNIAQFGGDSANVTLFGQSAGGHSVLAQIVSPGAKGLFQKAIISSGSYSLVQPSVEEASVLGVQIASNVGCGNSEVKKTAACLRSLSAHDLLEKGKINFISDQVVTDGRVIPLEFSTAFKEGRFNRVAVINGYNSNEGTFFAALRVLQSGHPIDRNDYRFGLKAFLGASSGDKLFAMANVPADSGDLGRNYADFFGRAKFICPTLAINSLLSKYISVYEYEFSDITAPSFLPEVSFPYKASHTSELQYIFKDFHGASGKFTPLNEEQKKLSSQMVSYWTNFARSGNPNSKHLPFWRSFKPNTESTLLFSLSNLSMITAVSDKYGCESILKVLER